MRGRIILSFIFFIFVVALLVFYWILPLNNSEFFVKDRSSNFSLGNNTNMQFYENMRFPNPEISYKIDDCTLQKQDDMKRAFNILTNLTILEFNAVSFNEEISVTCSSESKMDEGLFIAGEGGPTNITSGGAFNVIFHGTILLIKDSRCSDPNVALHELFHVLGFNHSKNSNNIMYPISKCSQDISEDMINLINELYSIPSYADLFFEDVSAEMNGKFLDTEFTIRNYGLKDSEPSKVKIYADGKSIKEVDVKEIDIGFGRTITLDNLLIPQLSVSNLEFVIETSFSELSNENNKVSLEIKK